MDIAKSIHTAAVLFSGGVDSSLAAIRMGMQVDRVVLLSMYRKGITGLESTNRNRKKLARFFGDQKKIDCQSFKTDRLLRFLLYENYLDNVKRHGFVVLSHCGLCKLSFHWRALVYCLENDLECVADGAVRTSDVYPEQNEIIMLHGLRELYSHFGISYLNPIYDEGEQAQEILYQLRYNRSKNVKGTDQDDQLICEQQILYAFFLRCYLPRFSKEEFEQKMISFYKEKITLVQRMTAEYLKHGSRSKLASLLE